jgi:molybdopterin-containing oxidoreductase family iron-sulfur binding subunit
MPEEQEVNVTQQDDAVPDSHQPESIERRELLTILSGTALAAAIAGGSSLPTIAGAAVAPIPDKRQFRYTFVVDTRKCVKCEACVAACKQENDTPPDVKFNAVLEDALGPSSNGNPTFFSRVCQQCDVPPCVMRCPVGASFKRERDGIVLINDDECIGCAYCVTACPYGARVIDKGKNYPAEVDGKLYSLVVPSPESGKYQTRVPRQAPIGTARKCTWCVHLQDKDGRYNQAEGRWPACVKTCPGRALNFGDLNDPESDASKLLREARRSGRRIVRLREELGTGANQWFVL